MTDWGGLKVELGVASKEEQPCCLKGTLGLHFTPIKFAALGPTPRSNGRRDAAGQRAHRFREAKYPRVRPRPSAPPSVRPSVRRF